MRVRFGIIFAAASVIFSIAGAIAQGKPESSRPPKSEHSTNGKALYVKVGCYECHGFAGQGSRLSGPKIGPQPIPLPAFLAYIRAPLGQMPPYTTKVISDADLSDIYAFLKSLPQPPSAEDIPLLK